jgi:hypothetical protein
MPAFRALLLASLCAALHSQPARAQYIMEFAQTYNAPMSNFISGTVMNNLGMINAASSGNGLRAPSSPQIARSARELAQPFPQAQRAKLEQLFTQSYDIYRKIESKFGWQPDDMAGAFAAFVVGNYMVYADVNVEDAHYVAVAAQFRGNPAMEEAFAKLKPQDLRAMYEQSAMVGAFMALTYLSKAQHPQPPDVQARVREAARANLQQVLGLEPGRLQIGPQGLRTAAK